MLAPETPYPLSGGGALRTASLLHYLARGYDVDLIVFRQPGAPDPARHMPAGLVRRISVVELPANRRSLPARALRNAARVAREVPPLTDRFSGFDAPIAGALAAERYDLGIVEHEWCAPYYPLVAQSCARTVLDLHNIESVLHERCAAVDPPAAAFAHRVFARAARDLERAWLPRFDEVLAVSESDASFARSLVPIARVVVYPNSVPLVPIPHRGDENAIVFSGNMEYHPNSSAVRFFRFEVWPRLRERWPGLVWRLVGKNPAAVEAYTSGDPRIEVLGEVEDAVKELARARVAVVPLLAGSGTRLKILEAWSAALPVVSTTLGAEGIGAHSEKHLLLADGAGEFADAVSRLLACPDLRKEVGDAGRSLLEKEFTWENAWKKLDF
jgi:glycosyltransferase involved in cell wall biosynthesis